MKLYESFEDEYKFFFVVELMQGKNLFDYMASLPHHAVTEQFVAQIMRQLLAGLSHCHANKLIHRDVNPKNLMFSDKACTILKLIDFGFAQMFDGSGSKFQGVYGSPIYTAPEVYFKKPYDAACDIWSSGILCFFILSGHFPYDEDLSDDLPSLISEIKQKVISEEDMKNGVWKTISKDAKNFILSMLNKEPKNRKTAEALLEDPWLKNANTSQVSIEDQKAAFNNLIKNHVNLCCLFLD